MQGYDRYAYSNNNPLHYADPTGHFPTLPCFVCIVPDLLLEMTNAISGTAPDHLGIETAKEYMSPLTMNPRDVMNTYTAAGIAIQSEVPDFGLVRDKYRSGRGIAQVSNGAMETAYGKKDPSAP